MPAARLALADLEHLGARESWRSYGRGDIGVTARRRPKLSASSSIVEHTTLLVAHLGDRWVADDLLDAAAQLGARHWAQGD